VIALVGLREKASARVKTLSGGQKRRLDLGIALIGDPDLVFLDEPTTGFDPQARRAAWEMIRSLRSLGKTVLLTTHYLDEAEQLSDRVGRDARGTDRARRDAPRADHHRPADRDSLPAARRGGARANGRADTRPRRADVCGPSREGEELEGLQVRRTVARRGLPRATAEEDEGSGGGRE
jgi:energy-coupling factor transporter ATP-binding protein EcfA2